MAEMLTDYGSQIADCALGLVATAEPYSGKYPELLTSLNFIRSFVSEKLVQNQPEIMVYGIYNAGKSSIINELIGRDEAEVNDKPTTYRVQYFNFNGYRIADTPGVGAPIEHEQITQTHLRKADVVIFVMSSTGSHDKAQNYERIRDIYNSDKKVIIVLNDKNGDLNKKDNNTIEEIKLKIGANLNAVGLENKFHIIAVNALRARRGRLEGKPALYEMSNMDELVQVIMQELKNSDGGRKWRTMVSQLITESGRVLSALEVVMKHSVSEEKIKNFLDQVRKQESFLRSDINAFIDRKMQNVAGMLPGSVWTFRNDKAKAEETIRQSVTEALADVKAHLRDMLREMKEHLNENAGEFNVSPTDINYHENSVIACSSDDYEMVLSSLEDEMSGKFSSDDSSGDLRANKKNSEENGGSMTGNIAVTLASAEAMKPLLISLGLKSFIPYIGPVLVVAGVLSVLFGRGGRSEAEAEVVADRENQREQARLQAETQARAELENKCRYMCMNLSDKMKSSVGRLISEVFKILVTPYKEQAFQIRDESGRLVECWENVKSRISELEHLREILRASD